MPLPYRWLTSLMMRYNGKSILIDCGEGTQIAMREKGWSPNPIDIICFTHFHADHISGLPGMLLTMGNAERTEPLLLIGPRGLTKVVASLRVIAPELPFEVKCIEITENAQTFSFEGFRLEAFRVNHNVLCYGYSMVIDRAGRFDKDRAMEQEIPMKFWSRLQKGETLEENGRVFTPDMVLGAERKGLKVTYSTDTRPTESIRQNSKGSDLLILEGMYGEPDKLVKAREHKHMTMYEAAKIAKEAEVPKLWLTHYSPSMTRPEEFMEDVRKIFPATYAAKDGWTMELKFDEKGLIPAIVQDHYTKEVLTLAYMNAETLALTIAEGRTVFWSRSRQEIWRKGETSGNVQRVVSITADCDADALVVEVVKSGPACHTGAESCFFNEVYVSPELKQFSWQGLYDLIKGRKTSPKEGSYTTYLFEKGKEKILKKVGEECTEVIIAGEKEDKAETVYEISDLAYHVLVLMVQAGITMENITRELEKRHVIDHKVKQERMQ